jgi:hypothetical protein
MYLWLSAVRADLRQDRYGHLHHHVRLRDLRRTPAWASSAAGLRAAASADGFGLLAGLLLGRLLVVAAELHLAENALALHLLLERLESLVDIVIANENLHAASSSVNRNGIG